MGQLEDIQVFIRVVDAGSISKAAEQLNIAKSAVSRRLSELEERLQTKLIQRTTRKFHLTDAGKIYYDKALQVVDSVQELNDAVNDDNESIETKLRVSIPLSFGLLHMSDAIDGFVKQYPKLELQVLMSDQAVNLVESGIDIAFRIGQLADSSIQARRIVPIDFVLCASPSFVEQVGQINCLADLADKPYLRYQAADSQALEMINPQGQSEIIYPQGRLQSNNGEFLHKMAVKGHGYVLMPRFISWQALQSKELIELLPDYTIPETYGYAVYPQNRYLSPIARKFIDYLLDYFTEYRVWQEA